MCWEQFSQLGRSAVAEHDLGRQVGRVHLSDELSAPTTRGQHVQASLLASPDRDDRRDAVLAGGDHRPDCRRLGAEASPAAGVDAHAAEVVSLVGDQDRRDVTAEPVSDAVRA